MKVVLLSLLLLPTIAHAREWSFNAYLDKSKIGEHIFSLSENGPQRQLISKANFDVKILFINAYHYEHTAIEKWAGDCLTTIDAKTIENKENTLIKGALTNSSFAVDMPKGHLTLPECPMTFAYWNPKMLNQRKLLNPQTGEWLDVNIKPLGNEQIEVRGEPRMAEKYRLEAPKMKIDLWYSPEKEWLELQSTTPEGYLITYKLK